MNRAMENAAKNKLGNQLTLKRLVSPGQNKPETLHCSEVEIMRADPMATTTNATVPATRAETADVTVLGSLPLLQGEDRAEYERWRAAVIGELKPADLMEKIWTNDIIYLEWEIIRFRRAKANYIRHLAAPDLLSALVQKLGDSGPHTDVATSIAANIGTLEPLERMIAVMEQRRNAAYHQVEQHRANLGDRLRQAVEQVEDAEFHEVDDEPAEQKCAA
jgi:hypothetical protein